MHFYNLIFIEELLFSLFRINNDLENITIKLLNKLILLIFYYFFYKNSINKLIFNILKQIKLI